MRARFWLATSLGLLTAASFSFKNLLPVLVVFVLLSNDYYHVASEAKKIVVVGSVNADTFLPVHHLPVEGENLICESEPIFDCPGGKGCTQAVACAKLVSHESTSTTDDNVDDDGNNNVKVDSLSVSFVGQFGSDTVATILQETLKKAGVHISDSGFDSGLPSGRGYVFRSSLTGQVSAVVSGGSNQGGWDREGYSVTSWFDTLRSRVKLALNKKIERILENCSCLLLQREVPEYVNRLFCVKAKKAKIVVIQDVGGSDRPMEEAYIRLCDYLVPNETELKRLVLSFGYEESFVSESSVVDLAKVLQLHGARNVLVTLGSKGSTLVTEQGRDVYYQPAFKTQHKVLDETGAGDCYRAAFAVALLEGRSLQACMEFASAAGSLSVEREGAVASTPTREEVEHRCKLATEAMVLGIPRGNGLTARGGARSDIGDDDHEFPFMIGSRLNSMKDRPELWGEPLNSPRDFVKRQAEIKGLSCVDFNYPQHFVEWTAKEAKRALDKAGLKAGAVCLRYPSRFARGAMNHPHKAFREEAIALTKEAAQVAKELGCNEVVVWSAYDGYDYPFQVNYNEKWNELVQAFRECCDAFPDIKFSVEYKPTDENTRFFTIPSTGAAMLMALEVNRSNFGLTLDVGHMLMSGENPGQSIAMVGRAGKLFGIQLNDGYTRLAAEDGLMFGSIHPGMALEIMFQLRKSNFSGHFYFDTFPQRTDPIKECEYNIERVKALWKASSLISPARLCNIWEEHDAIDALKLVDETLFSP